MNIAILGATSHIAKDLIQSFAINTDFKCVCFSRNPDLVDDWLKGSNITAGYEALGYPDFRFSDKYDVIINFVGVGDPAAAKQMGALIFEVTYEYDMMALKYLEKNPQTKYFFMSSGAVYGGTFETPAVGDSFATVAINNLKTTDWYAIAKLYAEARHRSLPDLSIIDIRIFNYFSHTHNIDARFLITDIVRAIKNKEIFLTSADNIVRDYITPPDFFTLIQSLINFEPVNLAVDCYTKAPLEKFLMLSELESKFGLQYMISEHHDSFNATGAKINYYSLNDALKKFGYAPAKSSLEGVIDEITLIDIKRHVAH